ncbi:recombinase family protein [Acidipila sp. EB88]|uniref:recombinase family protein n=1 Tax=Acidipila sp. EB88 TaxID=2305226 RepID=UPI000F5E7972|nr:recombinase family protein [Acidipila sp. EB88]RRA50355.1 recombinase family protein [Acidipila sp. EB88]RRA50363.1 recombinase family protein [Acidipila sp. EB88]
MNGQTVGYKRVSSTDQNTMRQLDGQSCDMVFEDKASGKDTKRPELARLIAHVRKGDTVLIHSMDRLARNVADLRKIVSELNTKGVEVRFLKESLTFTGDDSPMANLLLNLLGAVAEFERSMILERQREGITVAKAAGKYRGGQKKLTAEQVEQLKAKVEMGLPIARLAREFGVTRQTIYNNV